MMDHISGKLGEQTGASAEHATDRVAEGAQQVADAGKRGAQRAAEKARHLRDRAGEAMGDMRERADDALEGTRAHVRERPVTSIAVAVLAGLLVGRLLRLWR